MALSGVNPVNTKYLYIICTLLDPRRRRRADVVQTFETVVLTLFHDLAGSFFELVQCEGASRGDLNASLYR